MNASSKVMFSFAVVGSVGESEEFMQLVNGVGGKVVPVGFVFPISGKRNKEEYWVYETDYRDTDDIGSDFERSFAWLFDISGGLAGLVKRKQFDVFLDIAIKLCSENLPGFSLDRNIIGLIASFDAEIDIDLYQI